MLEFALIFPMLIILLFGFIEFGRLLYQQNELTKALTIGARFVARAPDAVAADCGAGGSWAAVTSQATNMVAYSLNGEPRLPGLDEPGAVTFISTSGSASGTSACVIKAAAHTQFDALFGETMVPFLNAGWVDLNALDEERYIGE